MADPTKKVVTDKVVAFKATPEINAWLDRIPEGVQKSVLIRQIVAEYVRKHHPPQLIPPSQVG